MLENVRSFVARLLDPSRATDFSGNEAAVAAVALMCHVLSADGLIEEEERDALRRVVAERFDMDDEATDALIAEATLSDQEAIDLYSFTSVLKRDLTVEERSSLISALWDLVYADGGVHELEDNVIWRVAELLGIDQRRRVTLKQEAASRRRRVR